VTGADELTDDEILERLGLSGDGLGGGSGGAGDAGAEGIGGDDDGALGALLLSPTGKRGARSAGETSVESILEASGGVRPVRHLYRAVRLDNNGLRSLRGLAAALSLVCTDLSALNWLDLSHNKIDSAGLREANLGEFPGLHSVHLHGNRIHGHKAVRAAFAGVVEGERRAVGGGGGGGGAVGFEGDGGKRMATKGEGDRWGHL